MKVEIFLKEKQSIELKLSNNLTDKEIRAWLFNVGTYGWADKSPITDIITYYPPNVIENIVVSPERLVV